MKRFNFTSTAAPSIMLQPGTIIADVLDTHMGSGLTKQELNLTPLAARSPLIFKLARLRFFMVRPFVASSGVVAEESLL